MRKMVWLLAAASLAGLSGCLGDDPTSPTPVSPAANTDQPVAPPQETTTPAPSPHY